jgi:hypothetical protein
MSIAKRAIVPICLLALVVAAGITMFSGGQGT